MNLVCSSILENIPNLNRQRRNIFKKLKSENKPKNEEEKFSKDPHSDRHSDEVYIEDNSSNDEEIKFNDQENHVEQGHNDIQYNLCSTINKDIPFAHHGLSQDNLRIVSREIYKILADIGIAARPETTVPVPKLHVGVFPGFKRFELSKQKYIPIMYRPWMEEVIISVNQYVSSFYEPKANTYAFALEGPQGIGKSHCLYLIAAKLKARMDIYRVFYLPECSFLIPADIDDIINELIFSFPDECAIEFIDRYRKDGDLVRCVKDIKKCYESKGITVILVFDQFNTIYADENTARLFKLIKAFSITMPMIVSYSANNNIVLTENPFEKYFPTKYEISDEEAMAFCRLYDENINRDVVRKVIAVTGGIPLEIANCFKEKGNSYHEKIGNYRASAQIRFEEGFDRFIGERKGEESKIANCMLGILLNTTDLLCAYDKKLVTCSMKSNGVYSYKFINNIAWKVVFNALLLRRLIDVNQLDTISKVILSSARTMATKGSEVEHYLIVSSILQRKFWLSKDKSIEFTRHVQFSSVMLAFKWTENALYYPDISNFPGFDFIVYDHFEKKLYLIQVTIKENSKSHRQDNSFMLNTLFIRFLSNLKTSLPSDVKVYEIYLVHSTNTPACFQDDKFNEIALSSLSDCYPALKELK